MVGSQVSYDIDLKILKVEISINLRCTIYVHSFKIDYVGKRCMIEICPLGWVKSKFPMVDERVFYGIDLVENSKKSRYSKMST